MTIATPYRIHPFTSYGSSLAAIAEKKQLERYRTLAEILRAARHRSPYRIDARGAARDARIHPVDLECLESGTPIPTMTVAPLQRLANVYETELSITLGGETLSYQAGTVLACLITAGAEVALLPYD